jgi:DNA-binding transcriptional regulator LsrR (DeoR family)
MEMINSGQKTQAEMARVFKINRSVISRLISKARVQEATTTR